MNAATYEAVWPTKRMRYVVRKRPTHEQLHSLSTAQQLSFLPMEAVGESGKIDLSNVRNKEDVEDGYTLFFDGDVLVAKITPCFENGKGAVARGLLNGVGYGTTELFVLTPTENVDPDFLYYVTYSSPFRLWGEAQMAGAAGQKRVTTEFVADFPVPVPPIDTQRRIAAYLDRETGRIDALIAAKERLLALLAEKRQALITHAVTRGLNPHAPLRPSGLPWLGEVPEHWEIQRLKYSLHSIEQGWSPQCDNRPADVDEWGVLKVGCVNGAEFDPNEQKALPVDVDPEIRYEIAPNDVLLSRGNTLELVGSASFVREVRPRLLLCDLLYRLRFNVNRIIPELVVHQLRSGPGRFQIEREASGTSNSMKKIGQETIQDLLLVVPPIDEQKSLIDFISRRTADIDAICVANQKSVDLLRERRSALIAAAVTGQLNVEA